MAYPACGNGNFGLTCAELFYTERAHLRMLKVLDGVFCQRLSRDAILPPDDVKSIFTNLDDIIQLHGDWRKLLPHLRKRRCSFA